MNEIHYLLEMNTLICNTNTSKIFFGSFFFVFLSFYNEKGIGVDELSFKFSDYQTVHRFSVSKE